MDWRMLHMLYKEPGIAVSAASLATGYDKGAVSRSLRSIEDMGLAEGRVEGTSERNKFWYLTRKGKLLHQKIHAGALGRQKLIFSGFKSDEIAVFNRSLKKIMANLGRLESDFHELTN